VQISIITICNKKDNNVEDLITKYISQIEKFYKISIINISFQTKKIQKNLYEKEYRKALSIIKPGSVLISLDESGSNYNSINFSKKMQFWIEEYSNIYFIIGGPDGLSDEVKNKSGSILSLSKLTFPHQLAKVILIEQLYRSISIMNNHPYHRS
jgi:23S rRNA (pseudouridine1915-N3)-methyltransferase